MAEADTLAYYGKLAAIRASQPVLGAVPYATKLCSSGSMSGDAIYTYRCPGAWLEFSGAPNAQSAQLVFPRDYFTWVKQYLSQAIALRPASSASAEFRVVWALDVWAHVNFALMAFPFPWSDIYSGGVVAVPELALVPVVFASGPKSIGGSSAEVAAWATAKADAQKTASTTSIRDAIVNSRLCPSAFSELAVQWAGAPGSRSRFYQQPNPIWPLLLAACQPWSAAWASNWLGSRGNKDAADIKRYATDPVMLRAVMQWRLWSIQDWGYVGSDSTYWPEGMGRADATTLLSTYIGHVRGEATAPKISFAGSQAYPNLAFGLDAVTGFARTIVGLNYDVVLQRHLDMWLSQSSPRLAGAGFATNADGTIARQPITKTDYADYFRGLRKAVTDRARIALANPALSCAPTDAACQKSVEYGAKVQQAIATSPLAPVQNAMLRVADKLVTLLGGAVGGGYEPLFVVRDPFARTFSAPGYRLVADGSTADLFYRIATAVVQYRNLLPGLFTATIAATARVARASCQVWWTRQQFACEICDGQPRPACAADVPNLPPPVAPKPSDAEIAAYCEKDWATFVAHSPYGSVVNAADRAIHDQLCSAMRLGVYSITQVSQTWSGYLQNKYGAADAIKARGGLLAAFTGGFFRSSNPLR